MVQFLDPEIAEILQFLDPEIVKMDEKISGSRNCRNGAISGSRNSRKGRQILYPGHVGEQFWALYDHHTLRPAESSSKFVYIQFKVQHHPIHSIPPPPC